MSCAQPSCRKMGGLHTEILSLYMHQLSDCSKNTSLFCLPCPCPLQCVVIEDALAGVQAATAAGIR